MKSVFLSVLCALTFLIGGGANAHDRNCFGSLRGALAKGGYSPGVDCGGEKFVVRIKPLGAIHVGFGRYRVYQLNYHYNPIPTNTHWGTRLLVFDGRGRYLGQYGVMQYGAAFHIAGHTLIANNSPKDGNIILFTPSGPPKTAWIDGEVYDFFR